MSKQPPKTQEQRRYETRSAVMQSASFLFATKGYENTSLEDIAQDCGLTTRPVYHYFGSKQALFIAIAEELEEKLAEDIGSIIEEKTLNSLIIAWERFLEICNQQEFRQIILVDAPKILGKERWYESSVVILTVKLLKEKLDHLTGEQAELVTRMIITALAEAAVMIGDADDPEKYIDAANELAHTLMAKFLS